MMRLEGVSKTYTQGGGTVAALSSITLSVSGGEMLGVVGPSGSGKSTLLAILGCIARPTSGEYYLEDVLVSSLSDRSLAQIRNRVIGFVFQAFYLLPDLNAVENVELPLVYRGLGRPRRRAAALEALGRVGLEGKERARAVELSGGEQQRVAIARAIVGGPRLILADEPTGNLDAACASEVMEALLELNKAGATLVIVTHNQSVWEKCGRVVSIVDGRIRQNAVGAGGASRPTDEGGKEVKK